MSECRTLAFGHEAGSPATVLGDRAGIVEWANEAFARLTGIPLADTVNKPVSRFLERAGLELEVVDFVAQHFFEGRPCRLEFPFERPDGRRIEVLLEVEALRDAMGEIDRFRATARERSDPAVDRLEPPASGPSESRRATGPDAESRSAPSSSAIPLAPAIHRALAAARRTSDEARSTGAEAWLLDLALSPEPLAIRGSDAALDGLVAVLVRVARTSLALADHAWGTITLTTGRTTPRRRFLSKVHAIPASAPAHADTSRIHFEVHDTGAPIDAAVLARLRRVAASHPEPDLETVPDSAPPLSRRSTAPSLDPGDPGDPREALLLDAVDRARRLGASIHLDSTPGCGNQILVLFPA